MKKKKELPGEDVVRVITVPVKVVGDKTEYERLCGEIRLFRAICARTAAALCTAELAGSDVSVVDGFVHLDMPPKNKEKKEKEPDGDSDAPKKREADKNRALEASAGQQILFAAFAGPRKNPLENFIIKKAPHWSNDLIQETARFVMSRWLAKDPEKKIQLRTRALTGEAFPTTFNFALLKIKWCPTCQGNLKIDIENRTITLKLDREKPYTLQLLTADPQTWHCLKAIASRNPQSPNYQPAGALIGVDDKGRIKLKLGYHWIVPESKAKSLNQNKTLEVSWNEWRKQNKDGLTVKAQTGFECRVQGGDRDGLLDVIRWRALQDSAAIMQIDRLKHQSFRRENERESAGAMPKSIRESINDRSARISTRRERTIAKWNHTWSKAIVDIARKYNCGKIMFIQHASNIRGRSWAFSGLKLMLQYKAKLEGMTIEWRDPPSISATDDLKAAGE